MIMRKAIFCLVVLTLLSMLAVGCAPKNTGRDPNMYDNRDRVRTGFLEHTVRYSGETLSIIAGWYTGRTDNWRRIVDVNPGLKPEKIRLGQIVMIPMELVVQEQPLTSDAVRKFRPSPRPAKEQPKDGAVSDGGVPPSSGDLFDSEPAPKVGDAAPGANAPTVVAPEVDNRPADSIPTDKPAMADTPPAAPHAADAAPKAPSKDDAEREKLLDELLSQ